MDSMYVCHRCDGFLSELGPQTSAQAALETVQAELSVEKQYVRDLTDTLRLRAADITSRDKRIANQREELKRLNARLESLDAAAGIAAEASRLSKKLDAQEKQNKYLHGVLEASRKESEARRQVIDMQSTEIRSLRDQLAEVNKDNNETTACKPVSMSGFSTVRNGNWNLPAIQPQGFDLGALHALHFVEKSVHDKEVAELHKEIARLGGLSTKHSLDAQSALKQLGVARGELDRANQLCKYRGDRLNALEKQLMLIGDDRRIIRDLLNKWGPG